MLAFLAIQAKVSRACQLGRKHAIARIFEPTRTLSSVPLPILASVRRATATSSIAIPGFNFYAYLCRRGENHKTTFGIPRQVSNEIRFTTNGTERPSYDVSDAIWHDAYSPACKPMMVEVRQSPMPSL
jgi:hypothetical protein